MSNARSLSTRRMPASTLTGLLRSSRWLLALLAIGFAGQALPLLAQCEAQVIGNVLIEDNSTPPGGANVCPVAPGQQNPWCGAPGTGPLPGSITVNMQIHTPPYPEPGQTFEFAGDGGAGMYFQERGPGAFCERVSPTCTNCSGTFALRFYSREGSLNGTVTYLPDGAPAANVLVTADRAPHGGSNDPQTPTNTAGYYEFKNSTYPNNKWGLRVDRAGTSGPGSEMYEAYVNIADPQLVEITSNGVASANFMIERPEEPQKEPDPRCGSQSQPNPGPSAGAQSSTAPSAPTPPCTVGCPVSVTTGNVDVDQTDATVPGRGLGLRFSRSYNSHNSAVAERHGVFGPGWNHSYEKRLTFPWVGPAPTFITTIKLRNSDGTITYFVGTDANGYDQTAPRSQDSRIVKTPSSNLYVRLFKRGGQEVYDRLSPGGVSARLISIADAVNNTTVLTYAGNKLTSIADPGGRRLTLGYTGDQITALCSSTSPISCGPSEKGLIATYTYVGTRLGSVTYADGNGDAQSDGGSTFAYYTSGAGNGKLWKVTDGSGRVTETHQYGPDGRAIWTEISGGVRRYDLLYQADRTIVTDSLENQTEYQFQIINGIKRITRTIGSCSSCGGAGSATEEWGYDDKGRVISHTDGEGNVTEYEYDGDGNLRLIRGPVMNSGPQHVTEMVYDANGRLVSRIAPNLATTTWTYAPPGPETITEEVSPGVTRTTTFVYYASGSQLGKLRYRRDPLNRQTEFLYTVAGDLTSVVDPSGHSTSFQYDSMGRRTKTILPATTPANDTPTTSYDTLGRVWKITNPNGSYWQNTYDGGGRRTVARDPAGKNTNYVYDAYGRLSTVTNSPDGSTNYTTEYRYDEMSNLRYLIDPRQYPQPSPVPTTATEFRYEDGHNRVTSVHYPGLLTEEFTYDLAGRLLTRTDRKGVETAFTYDALGRLTGKTYSNGSAPVTFTYDGGDDAGFLTGASNSADTLAWDYDEAGQMLSESSTRNGTTVSYQYFLTGERQKLRLNGSDVLTYAYEPDGQLNTLTRAAGVVFDFNPDPAHRRQNVIFPNGTTTEYGYDPLSRLSLIRLKRGATVLNDIAYESNDLNNRTSRTENGTRLQYTYDDLSRLDTVNQTLPTSVLKEDYSYDPVGNRLTALGVPGLWSYNERNELTSYNGINFTYDLNGNQRTRSGPPNRVYSWNVENRLDRVSENGAELVQFEYDPLGRRVTKTPIPGGQTRFAYDGEDILFEQGPSGNFTYLHGPGIDEPLARETSTAVRTYYHADGLGSIVKRTDGAGNVIGTQSYDSFGVGTAIPEGYAYTGREWDLVSQQYHYRFRSYEAAHGRFLSEDPLRHQGGMNLFLYVENNPISKVDPMGLESGNINEGFDIVGPQCTDFTCYRWGYEWQNMGFSSARDCIAWTMATLTGYGAGLKGAEEILKRRTPKAGQVAAAYAGGLLFGASINCNAPVCLAGSAPPLNLQ